MTVRNVQKVLGDGAYILHDSFLGADSVSILQLMLGEIDFRDYTSFLNLADSLFNLGFRSGHSPRFGAFERLPRLFYGGGQGGKDGKSAGVVREVIGDYPKRPHTSNSERADRRHVKFLSVLYSIYSLWAIAMNQNTPPKCVLQR